MSKRQLILLLANIGCATGFEAELAEPPTIVAIRPAEDVAPTDPVSLVLSAPVRLVVASMPVRVVDADGRGWPAATRLTADGAQIAIEPIEPWPMGAALSVLIAEGLEDVFEQRLIAPAEGLRFRTRASHDLGPMTLIVRSPRQGTRAPINLRQMSVTMTPTARVEAFVLEAAGHRVIAPVVLRGAAGEHVARLPDVAGPCAPLCADATYVVMPMSSDLTIETAGEIRTTTVADVVPPQLTAVGVDVRGDTVHVRTIADEPVYLRGVAQPGEVVLSASLIAERRPLLTTMSSLLGRTEYTIQLDGEDLAGNRLEPVVITATTPHAIQVAITEVVATPLRDWNDSAPAGRPYDATPGGGAVTDADEWIELVNASGVPIDLATAGLVVRIHDGTPTETRIEIAPALVFGADGDATAWQPGEALLVRPYGAMSQQLTVEVVSGQRVLDRVRLGEGGDHPGGRPPSLEYDAIARDPRGLWRWCVPTPLDPLPALDCAP